MKIALTNKLCILIETKGYDILPNYYLVNKHRKISIYSAIIIKLRIVFVFVVMYILHISFSN